MEGPMIRKFWAWPLLAVATILMGTTLPDVTSQTVRTELIMYDTGGNRVTSASAEFRAYVNGEDSSLAGNQQDFTYDSDCQCFYVAVDTTSSYNIYRIDAAVDTLYSTGVLIHGKYTAKNSVYRDAIVANAIGSAEVEDASLTDDDIASLDGSKISSATIPATALEAGAAIANMTTGSGKSAYIDLAGTDGTGSAADTFNLKVDSLTVYDKLVLTGSFSMIYPVSFGDSAYFGGPIRADGDLIELGNSSGDVVNIAGNLEVEDDMVFGLTDADEAKFRGPIILTDIVRDSIPSGTTWDTVLVAGVSTMLQAGYTVTCQATYNWTWYQAYNAFAGAGAGVNRSWWAGVKTQTTANGDSVYVGVNTTVLGKNLPYCVICWGEE